MRLLRFLSSLLCLALTSCFSENQIDSSLDGYWQTVGYGYIFQIKGEDVAIFETTAVSCINSILQPGALRRFVAQEEEAQFSVEVPGFIDAAFVIRPGERKHVKYFNRTDTVSSIRVEKTEALPSQCSQTESASFNQSLTVFLSTFKEHYPFFEQKGISWDQLTNIENRADGQSDKDLFRFLVELVMPLMDPHIIIVAPSINEFFFGVEEFSRQSSLPSGTEHIENIIQNYLLRPQLSYCNNNLILGELEGGVAYLNVQNFEGCVEESTFEKNLSAFEKELDAIFQDSAKWSGLIIDIRSNSGGSDKLALALISRLAQKQFIAYEKQAAVNYQILKQWSPRQKILTPRSNGANFLGKTVLLTDNNSISAAETFSMASMGRQPSILRIGGATRGAFSDILPRILPNGFLLGLPNERYVTVSGESFDQLGIHPDVEVLHSVQEFEAGRDVQLDAAITQFVD